MASLDQPASADRVAEGQVAPRTLTLGHVVIIALAVGLFAAVWLAAYSNLSRYISGTTVSSRRTAG